MILVSKDLTFKNDARKNPQSQNSNTGITAQINRQSEQLSPNQSFKEQRQTGIGI